MASQLTLTEFDALVRRLEALEAADPRVYRRRVAALALGGYAYVIGVLLLVLSLWGAGVALGLAITSIWLTLVCLAGFFTTLVSGARALRVELEPPSGRALTREEAPALFDMLDELREELGAPKIHEVLLVGEYNAAMMQTPRLGVLGWWRTTLILGVPLMLSLDPEELRAVIGHELGHAAGQHSRFSGWIYRLRQTWARIQQDMLARGEGSLLYGRFLRRFVPYFNAYTFVLARANEYEADRASARVTSSAIAGRALLRVHLDNLWLDEHFWGELGERNKHEALAPERLYFRLEEALDEERDEASAKLGLGEVLARRTDFSDTHPSLRDRLAALEVEPDVPAPITQSAAEAFLGPRREALLEEFSHRWRESMAQLWGLQHLQHRQQQQELEAFEVTLAEEELAPLDMRDEELERYVALVEAERGREDALALWQQVHDARPDWAAANFSLGRLLMQDRDERAPQLLERALELDERYAGGVSELMMSYTYDVLDDKAAAEVWLARYEAWQVKLAEARTERAFASPSDTLLAVEGLDERALEALAEELRRHPSVKRAWIAEKQVEHFPEQRLFVLGVQPVRTRAWTATRQQELIQEIAASAPSRDFPFELLVFNLADSNLSWLKKRLRRIDGAQIAP